MIRDVTDMYNRHLITILGLCCLFVVPITFFLVFTIDYIYDLESIQYPSLYAIFLFILNFSILFPPFSLLASRDMYDRDYHFLELVRHFVKSFGLVLFFTMVCYFLMIFGSVLLLIPTILGIVMIFLYPLFVSETNIKKSFTKMWNIIINENIFILLDIIIVLSLNLLVWSGITYLVAGFENNLLVYITLRSLLHSLIFPIIYFYLTLKYKSTTDEGSIKEVLQ